MIHASIRIDPARRIASVHPNVYGQFIEHLGRCIYGGIDEPASPPADEHGFRTDVVDAVSPAPLQYSRQACASSMLPVPMSKQM